jgi:hypothetical protein
VAGREKTKVNKSKGQDMKIALILSILAAIGSSQGRAEDEEFFLPERKRANSTEMKKRIAMKRLVLKLIDAARDDVHGGWISKYVNVLRNEPIEFDDEKEIYKWRDWRIDTRKMNILMSTSDGMVQAEFKAVNDELEFFNVRVSKTKPFREARAP